MVAMARAAEADTSVVYFGVAAASEALELRRSGLRKPILVLAPVHPSQILELVRNKITLAVSSIVEAQAVDRAARRAGLPAKIHAELDTGMGRLGEAYGRALKFLFSLKKLTHVRLEGAYTHFPGADGASTALSKQQIKIFGMVVDLFRELYPGTLPFAHMANSAGLLKFEDAHFNLVRPGLAAYGVNPVGTRPDQQLRPVMSVRTRVAFLKTVERGTPISYGSTYRTKSRSVIATLPIGYSSGYPLRLSNRSRVLIRGRSFKVAGRVTMDQIMVDLGGWTGARLWEEVTLIGVSGRERVSAEELARLSGTIPYEILCGIHPKVPRMYTA
jgi:alanine racemase